ncbi:hypothetical protein ACC676_38965, partial [Rhizobium ruizarguesonis]
MNRANVGAREIARIVIEQTANGKVVFGHGVEIAFRHADRVTGAGLRFGPADEPGDDRIAVDEVALGAALPEIGKVSP